MDTQNMLDSSALGDVPVAAADVLHSAQELYAQNPDWVTFYREVLALDGMVRRRFPSRQAQAVFEQTEAYAEIQQMLSRLRERSREKPRDNKEPTSEGATVGVPEVTAPEGTEGDGSEPVKVITVRIPKSLHEALKAEAHEHQTSMNKLCISKLLQFIDNSLVPAERT